MKYRLSIPELLVLAGSCVACVQPASGQLDGVLFTSPDERAYLDYLRREFLANSREAGFDIDAPTIPQIPAEGSAQDNVPQQSGPVEFSLGGILTVGPGNRSVWLNGQLLPEHALPAHFSIESDGYTDALRITTDSHSFRLLPGQTLNTRTGLVTERYQHRKNPDAQGGGKVAEMDAHAAGGDHATP